MTITATQLTGAGFTSNPVFTVATAGGKKLVAAFATGSTTATAVSDSAGNTWALATKDETASRAATYIYETTNASPTAITSITISTGFGVTTGVLYESVELDPTVTADKVAHSNGTGTSMDTSSTASLGASNDVEIGVFGWGNSASALTNSSTTFTSGGGTDHTQDDTFVGQHYQSISSSRFITASTAAQKYTSTLSGTPTLGWTGCIATFRQTTGGLIKEINGLATASVKKVDNNSNATLKTINGLFK